MILSSYFTEYTIKTPVSMMVFCIVMPCGFIDGYQFPSPHGDTTKKTNIFSLKSYFKPKQTQIRQIISFLITYLLIRYKTLKNVKTRSSLMVHFPGSLLYDNLNHVDSSL
jgi:hypothetical protein